MAKYTINQLPSKAVAGTDEVELQASSGGLSGKATVNDLKTYISNTPTFTSTNAIIDVHYSTFTLGSKDYHHSLYGYGIPNHGNVIGYVYDQMTPANSFWHSTPWGATEGNGLLVNTLGNVGVGLQSGASTYTFHAYRFGGCSFRLEDSGESFTIETLLGFGSALGTVGSTPLVFNVNSVERARIDTSGYALIGYSSSNGAYKLQVNSQIFATNATVATSDARYKENITTLTDGLSLVNALRPVSYTWKAQQDIKASVDIKEKVKDDKGKDVLVTVGREDVVKREKHAFDSNVHIGFLAQEVLTALQGQPYVDSIVKLNGRPPVLDADGNEVAPKEEFYGLAHVELIALLVKAVQELSAKVTTLEAKVK